MELTLKILGMRILDTSLFSLLLILSSFVLAAAFFPVFGFFFLIFLPLITFLYSVLYGKIKTAVAFLIPVGLAFLFSHALQLNTSYLVILIMGIVGITIATVALKNSSIEKTIIYPALIIVGSVCASFIYSGIMHSFNPWQLVSQFVSQTIEQTVNLYSQLPLEKEDILLIQKNKHFFISIFTSIFPALVIIGSIIIVWINVLLSKNILHKAKLFLPQLEDLALWKAPEFIIWIFIIAGGLLLISNEQIRFFSLNIFILTCFIYFLQGLAIVGFLFQKKNVPSFFRYLFYFFIAVQQFLMIPIIAAGLFDIWVDFRKYFHKNQDDN